MASTKIFIGAVPPNAREEDVHELFGAHGSIEKVFMKQGFAFVEFSDSASAQAAVDNCNGKDLLGSALRVEIARPSNGPRRDGGSRFGSGGSGGSGERRPGGCYNCGQDGHIARSCTEPANNNSRPRSRPYDRDGGSSRSYGGSSSGGSRSYGSRDRSPRGYRSNDSERRSDY